MRSYQMTAFGAALEPVDAPTPAPTGTEVLLKISACGVCHSDLHLRDGYFGMGEDRKLDLSRGIPLPHVLGHEIVGEVVALGPDARGAALGDRRVVYPWIGCGECAVCARGEEQLCAKPCALGVNVAGGYADHVLVPHPRYLLDFAGIPEEIACTYACSGLTAYGALKKVAPLGKDDPLLIIGAGGVGLAAVRMAKQVTGMAPVVADIDAAKRDAAMAGGASASLDPAAEGAAKNLIRSTGGGVAAAIDFVGADSSFQFGFDVLRKGGRLVSVGLLGGSFRVALPLLPLRAISLMGSYVASLADLRDLIALGQAGAIPPIPVSSRPLARVEATLQDLKAGRILGRAVVRP
jgi:D-arabinose 1-dehydrogenase-like Zn-dependent alcohol dehydrogenase